MDISQIPVDIRIGKRGINENIISEIKNRLKHKKVIKIKFLRAFLENFDEKRKKIITGSLEIITKATKSNVIEIRGNTAIIKSLERTLEGKNKKGQKNKIKKHKNKK